MRLDVAATPIWMYTDDVMRRLDRNWDGRIETNDPSHSFRTRNFLRNADRNMNGSVDRWELENEISWAVDRNMDRRIDDNERRDAWLQHDLPAFGRGQGPQAPIRRDHRRPAVVIRF
jgi:hypothetical protein